MNQGITFRSLWTYERALGNFQRRAPVLIGPNSFRLLSAHNSNHLPATQTNLRRDGTRGIYRLYDSSAKKVLVLVHGSACFGDQLNTMASEISRLGVAKVATLNLRGHGLDAGERGKAVVYPEQLLHDLEDLFAELPQRFPGHTFYLGGHSAGGGVALGFSAMALASKVSGYVLLAPYAVFDSLTNRPNFGGWIAHLAKWKIRLLAILNVCGITAMNNTVVATFNLRDCHGDTRYVSEWSLNTALAFAPPNETSSLSQPVIVMAGTADECFDSAWYAQDFAAIAPQASIKLIENCGHFDVLVDMRAIEQLSSWLSAQP